MVLLLHGVQVAELRFRVLDYRHWGVGLLVGLENWDIFKLKINRILIVLIIISNQNSQCALPPSPS